MPYSVIRADKEGGMQIGVSIVLEDGLLINHSNSTQDESYPPGKKLGGQIGFKVGLIM